MFNKNTPNQENDSKTVKTVPNLDDFKAHIKDKSDTSNGTSPVYLISEGTTVVGDITSNHGIRISGKVKGTVKSNGKCIIAATAEVEGDLKAVDAEISGYVNGEIIVSNKLVLRESARVIGKVSTAILNMEDGAKLSGTCDMKFDEPKKTTPHSEPKIVEDKNSTVNQNK